MRAAGGATVSLMVGMLFSPLTGLASVAGFAWIAACLYVIAKKTNTENPWLAWIPVANLVPACLIAGRPWWWGFLFAISLVNLITIEIVVWKTFERRNKPGWLALLMLVPVANMVILSILAFVV